MVTTLWRAIKPWFRTALMVAKAHTGWPVILGKVEVVRKAHDPANITQKKGAIRVKHMVNMKEKVPFPNVIKWSLRSLLAK